MTQPKFSFKKAAEKILREADRPLSPQEIVERALDAGLIETDGVFSPSFYLTAWMAQLEYSGITDFFHRVYIISAMRR